MYVSITYDPFLQLIPEDFELLEFQHSSVIHLHSVQENSATMLNIIFTYQRCKTHIIGFICLILYLNLRQKWVSLDQGSASSVLEGRCPAEFSSNPNQTHLKQLIKLLLGMLETSRQVCWGKLELNSAGHRPSRIKFDDPWFRLIKWKKDLHTVIPFIQFFLKTTFQSTRP